MTTNEQVVVFATWVVTPAHLDTVLQLLPHIATASRAEAGNLQYTACQSAADPNTILLYEVYEDQAAVEAHKNSPHYQQLVAGQVVPLLSDRKVTLATPL